MDEPRALAPLRVAELRLVTTATLAAIGQSGWYEVAADELGLTFRADTPYEAWEADTLRLLAVARSIQWLVGDALAYGEQRWPEQHAQVLDPRYTYDTVSKFARTARAIPPGRRRPDVSYTVHEVVAFLPEASQELLLDEAQLSHATVAEVRVAARQERRRLDREAASKLAVPRLSLDGISIGVGDALALPLAAGSVDLIVTSPPYGLDSERTAKYRQPDPAEGWVALMAGFCCEAFRVLGPQGRLVVNVPLDTTIGGNRPTYAQLVGCALSAGFSYRCTIVWADEHLRKSVARGSIDSPGGVNVVAPCELVAVFHKGEWIRAAGSGTSDLGHGDWLYWTNGLWPLAGEGRAWEGFEAAFPLELPLRLVKLFSYREDVVCDPFLGSGTTAVAAYTLARRFLGFDLDRLQIASSLRRLALLGEGRSG